MSKIVAGIDLGTGNSCVAVMEGGKPIVVANAEGDRTTPSVVSLKDGERKVGKAAQRQRITAPKETIFNVKRFMGSDYNKCSEVISRVPYEVENQGGLPRVKVDGRLYSPEEISSYIVAKMQKTAEDYLGQKVTDVVITCPAWFDSAAREATKLAGEMCGMNVLRVINEPTAAILASNLDTSKKDVTVCVSDIGQGTSDFSVCEISEGMVEVLASYGDVFLGGSDWDNALADYLIENFKNEYGIDLKQDAQAYTRVLEAAENVKKELSNTTSAEVNLPYITVVDGTPQHLVTTVTRAKFEQITSHLVDKVVECAKKAIEKADVKVEDIDCFLLVGGQTRSLAIQEALTKAFNRPLNKSVNPDEAVALGAVTEANILVGGTNAKDILLVDVTPLPLGIETMGGVNTILVDENTTIPVSRTQIFSTAVDNQPAVTIHVVQGGRPYARDNKSLGQFNLDGIMPAKRGVPQIEVKFDIDANGILTVSATDKATGKEQHITIENNNSLSKEEIERIKKEQEQFAAEDEKSRENIKRGNMCESLIYQTERSLEDLKEHITDEDRQFFNEKLDALKKRQEEKNYDGIEQLADEVNSRWHTISTKAYTTAGDSNKTDEAFNAMKDMFGNTAGNPFAKPQ